MRRARQPLVENIIALAGSMIALGVATLWVARAGGPVAVGDYALLRILPWLLAVIVSGGLAGSIAYFLSGPTREDRRVPSTLVAIAAASAVAGALLWLAATPLLHLVFFRSLPLGLVAWVSVRVLLRLIVITGKAGAQGSADLPGSNLTILLEELIFLPAFGLMQALHLTGDAAVIAALIVADFATGSVAWTRLLRRGFLKGAGRPSVQLARRIYAFGTRGQVGSLMSLLNLRFDFVFLAALAGPATLGIYAVASKYAEVLRLLPIAANWVLYPRFARSEAAVAASTSRQMILRAGAVTAGASIPLAIAAGWVVPPLFGASFTGATLPARILLVGLAAEGVAGVVTAFLFGRGRPGLNSLAAGAGVVVTLVLDIILIPRFGAVGAAVASSAAYLTTTLTLVFWYRRLTRPLHQTDRPQPVFDDLVGIAPRSDVRVLDVAIAVLGLIVSWPLLLVLALASRMSTGGSPIYRQVRVGQGSVPFTMYKLRSMRFGQDGPEITGPSDSRITRFGAFIRATSLDELPQMVNVLRGDMTLVGPRPETVALALRYPVGSRRVFAHRPGLTGPVQITFRDAVPEGVDDVEEYYLTELIPQRTELDLAYASRATLLSALALIARTASHVVSRVFMKIASRSLRQINPVLGLKRRTT
jgi:lipopolysaccharide/colanic/teichoic acid biosynthesis glycosyltransferase/O-antigen/teichoic acid export membrane protein